MNQALKDELARVLDGTTKGVPQAASTGAPTTTADVAAQPLEPAARGPAVPGGGDPAPGADQQSPVDAALRRRTRRTACAPRQDHDGAATLRPAIAARRLGHHRGDRASAPGLPAIRDPARVPREPVDRPAGCSLRTRRVGPRPGLRVLLPGRFDRRRGPPRAGCRARYRQPDQRPGGDRHSRRALRLPNARRGRGRGGCRGAVRNPVAARGRVLRRHRRQSPHG